MLYELFGLFVTEFIFFKPVFSNLVANMGYESFENKQNFIFISLKLCLLGKKTLAHGV